MLEHVFYLDCESTFFFLKCCCKLLFFAMCRLLSELLRRVVKPVAKALSEGHQRLARYL
jgi:hypothetical protein